MRKTTKKGQNLKRLITVIIVGWVLVLIGGIVLATFLNRTVFFPTSAVVTYSKNNPPQFINVQEVRLGEAMDAYILSPDDIDYFTFNIDNQTRVNVSLKDLPQDYDVVLYTPDDSFRIRSMKSSIEGESFIVTLEPGQYYIRVYSKSGDFSNKPYKLIVNTYEE